MDNRLPGLSLLELVLMLSLTRCMNTGAPQGTVLSLFLFSLNIADCRSQSENTPIVQFADDTGLTGLLTMTTSSHYWQQIRDFVDWCELPPVTCVKDKGNDC